MRMMVEIPLKLNELSFQSVEVLVNWFELIMEVMESSFELMIQIKERRT
jgi:hypothetical protein